MGYTTYFARPRVLPKRKFRAAVADCRTVCEQLTAGGKFTLRFESNSDRPPEFSDDAVRFNGVGEDGHETFEVRRVLEPGDWQKPTRGLYSDFCKTARKPYDLAVCCCLIVFRHHFGKRFDVSSDGDDDEANWPLARAACHRVLGYGEDFELTGRDDFGRMGVGGIPARKAPGEPDIHELANGWAVRVRVRPDRLPAGAPRTHRAVLYSAAYHARHYRRESVVLTAPTLADARWLATARFIEDKFAKLPEFALFFPGFREGRDWAPLHVYADRLEDFGLSREAAKLRDLLPRAARRV